MNPMMWLVPVTFKAIVHIAVDSETKEGATEAGLKQFSERYTGSGVFAEGKYVEESARADRHKTRKVNDG